MDELLLRRAQQGDPEAFESLMEGFESLVWRICWHYTGNREDASDCGQEAMIRIWRSLPSFRFDCAFQTWVYRLTANCCLDLLRRRKRGSFVPLDSMQDQGFDPPDPSPGPETQAIRQEEQESLRQAIVQLPDEQRDALVLTQLEGLSYAEAALMLGTTEGTVKSRVSRARGRLKEYLVKVLELSGSVSVQKKERRDHS